MKYILEYIKDELFIEPVSGTTVEFEEEFAGDDIPIGYRLILNGKDVDIVVWYADYNRWLEKRFDTPREIVLQDVMDSTERERYDEFCKKHSKCGQHSTIGGGVSVIVTGTGLGYTFECRCNRCNEIKDITNIENW
jgi:hypothetical protein